ncbi:uncharacterized protein L969DRAFT_16421 [Mixia osmundae IAM 14324]|uniref:Zinc finger C2H2 LYAR-type domain-containing protein n=1 Tax=Mixia osmundae (strain CBS 9802 / IAM 14324 / JCM 22182 / KY 12970) TaxID=764103 RepID=G7DUE0_MIXOS|nr:uncharacterized protein L969DRAFT_16421 [Mixia osmundae IAM 14324]KEI41072.1 hypothetical protein L969DRAFT_16421 [Mixia osmundae IAM 14324]GAA94200.1 hypothetical protein E5Q_00848 [Mixia osmundae IAM 14324]
MVSFSCEGCGDVITKPKLKTHFPRCKAPVTCIDCNKTFDSPAQFSPHTSCISEAEKYEKSVYKGPKKSTADAKDVKKASATAERASSTTEIDGQDQSARKEKRKRKRESAPLADTAASTAAAIAEEKTLPELEALAVKKVKKQKKQKASQAATDSVEPSTEPVEEQPQRSLAADFPEAAASVVESATAPLGSLVAAAPALAEAASDATPLGFFVEREQAAITKNADASPTLPAMRVDVVPEAASHKQHKKQKAAKANGLATVLKEGPTSLKGLLEKLEASGATDPIARLSVDRKGRLVYADA